MKIRKLAVLLTAAALTAAAVTGCIGGKETEAVAAGAGTGTETGTTAESTAAGTAAQESSEEETADSMAAEDEENYDTGDASKDNTRNQDGIGEDELLVVSFGTSYNDNRRLTVGAIEDAMEKAFPDYSVRRGFTSQIIIDHVKSRDNVAIDNVGQALERAEKNGVRNLVIQPTHLMDGLEYTDLVNEVAEYSDAFEKVAIGKPLLTTDDDFKAVMKAVTEADSNHVYAKMQDMLADAGYKNYYVGTVEAEPSLEDVLAKVKEGSYKKVVLEPLMIVAGDHANNDMAGDEEDSWKTAFEGAGYEVTCLVRGLGEMEAIQQLFVEHAQAAVDSLSK